MESIVVVGSSGHAKVVLDILEKQGAYRIAGLIASTKPAGEHAFGYEVLGTESDLPVLADRLKLRGCLIAIGDNWRRHLVAQKLMQLTPALDFIAAVHPSAQLARGASVGRGSVIMAGAVVNSDSRVGEFCILNTHASLDHDSVMQDFSSLAPKAATGGNVHIGEYSAISMGANVIHGRRIGRHSVVGAGALVLEDLPDFAVAYGVPARVIRTRQEGDVYL
jgi:sugar O-acyltransferase (sialic acid O-acetyltransferase NeuD family)